MLENIVFQFLFHGVGEFHARMREEFYAVVLKRIVRGGDHHACLKIVLANQASHSGRGDDSGESNGCAGLRKARGQERSDVRAGFARVHADQDMRCTKLALQVSPEGTPCGVERGVIQRRSTGHASNAIGSEKFFGHGVVPVSSQCCGCGRLPCGQRPKSLTQGKGATL